MRTAREAAKLSLRETARRMGVSASYLSDLELNRRHISAKAEAKFNEAIKAPASMSRIPVKVLEHLGRIDLSTAEATAVHSALRAGAQFGYGNMIAWLATAWAVDLRDADGVSAEAAIAVVSNRSPYPLPE